MTAAADTFDLVVIGGGPGGATAATFVALQGHRVLLLERETLPFYKIGESLLPSTVNGVCVMLGVAEELRQANFVKKHGGTFLWGTSKTPWTFDFSMSSRIKGPTSFAYQVERAKFDAILLDNARRKGVDVRERHTVQNVIRDGDGRVTGVVYRDDGGATRRARSTFVIDASGWTTTLGRHVGERIYSKFFRNVAVFGYFDNAKRLPPPCAGNIFCAAFDQGWFWYIPLSDTLTSVGAVIGQEFAAPLSDGVEQTYRALIDRCPPIRDLLAGATRVSTGRYGEVRVRKDYSYCHSRFWAPGLALVGDAACFIDPVFSSGVHLATYAGLLAARSINSCLGGSMTEARAFGEFERRYLREYRYFYEFLVAFYDLDQDLESYYWSARKVVGSADAGNEAFVQLVAGVAGSGEPLFAGTEDYVNGQAHLSRQLFPRGSSGAPADSAERSRFLGELLSEAGHVQALAALKEQRGPELPLFQDGLVPSVNGLQWSEPAA